MKEQMSNRKEEENDDEELRGGKGEGIKKRRKNTYVPTQVSLHDQQSLKPLLVNQSSHL